MNRSQLNPPATDQQIAEAEERIGVAFPQDVRELYRIANGQLSPFDCAPTNPDAEKPPFELPPGKLVGNLFGCNEFNSLSRLVREWTNWKQVFDQPNYAASEFDEAVTVREGDSVRKQYANPLWIPIATDGGGNSYAIDMDPVEGGTVGQVIVIGPDENQRRVLAESLPKLFDSAASHIPTDIHESNRWVFFKMLPN